jgi:hypothetical protein
MFHVNRSEIVLSRADVDRPLPSPNRELAYPYQGGLSSVPAAIRRIGPG